MKKVISVETVEEAVKKGEIAVDASEGAIITPAARDYAAENGVGFCVNGLNCSSCENQPTCPNGMRQCGQTSDGAIDEGLIYDALSSMSEDGSLGDIKDIVSSAAPSCNVSGGAPYIADEDPSGLKIIKGGSVNYEFLETDKPSNQVYYQEVICSKNSKVFNAGFLTVDSCSFPWEVGCDEMYYVIDGPLNIMVNGKTFTANAGDVVNLPVGRTVQFSASGKAKMFYGIKAAE